MEKNMKMTFSEWEALRKKEKRSRIRKAVGKIKKNYITAALVVIGIIAQFVCEGDNTAGVFFLALAAAYGVSVNGKEQN